MSWKPEVMVLGESKWCGNGLIKQRETDNDEAR